MSREKPPTQQQGKKNKGSAAGAGAPGIPRNDAAPTGTSSSTATTTTTAGGGGVAPDRRRRLTQPQRDEYDSQLSSLASCSTSLLSIVVDVSPLAWGERDLQRSAQDRARFAAGKKSVGPVTLPELLESLHAFCSAYLLCEGRAGLVVVGVADSESAVLFPRRGSLSEWLDRPDTHRANLVEMRRDVTDGVSELMRRASAQAQAASNPACRHAAMASAFSTSLCLVNRFLVASRSSAGVSALDSARYLTRSDDDGVVALMGGSNSNNQGASGSQPGSGKGGGGAGATATSAAWSPRILLVQASEDRSQDYNAFMNCAFAAVKHGIAVDGCFLAASPAPSAAPNVAAATGPAKGPAAPPPTAQPASSSLSASSAFLEQACDLTSGVFLAPSGAAQVDGALTEVLCSVFLPPVDARPQLNLPALTKVDFRARCFETADIVDQALVCNLCLSLFKNRPVGRCPTCEATIYVPKEGKRKR